MAGTYGYDAMGKWTSVMGAFASHKPSPKRTLASYDAANELVSWGGSPLTYDDNGNLLYDGAHTYAWDARNQLATMDSGNTGTSRTMRSDAGRARSRWRFAAAIGPLGNKVHASATKRGRGVQLLALGIGISVAAGCVLVEIASHTFVPDARAAGLRGRQIRRRLQLWSKRKELNVLVAEGCSA